MDDNECKEKHLSYSSIWLHLYLNGTRFVFSISSSFLFCGIIFEIFGKKSISLIILYWV